MESQPPAKFCDQCGTQIPSSFLNCPGCQKLVYSAELKKFSEDAGKAFQETRLSDAMASWRGALELLPVESKQYRIIQEKIEALGKEVDSRPAASGPASTLVQKPKSLFGQKANKAGFLGLLILVFSKLKFLALGFAKVHTLLSMLLAFGVYWSLWGWKFALGLVLSIYVHEMGHVAALNRYGIKATAPMFIPGLGAFVRLKQNLANPREDARVGLAGPIWGLGAALAAFALYQATKIPVLAGIARIGAWVNLFNLMPVWQLDGGRGFKSLAPWQRWAAALLLGVMLYFSKEPLLLILIIAALFQALQKGAPSKPDHWGLMEYALLIIILSMMCTIQMPTP